jgi:hypothetical protein
MQNSEVRRAIRQGSTSVAEMPHAPRATASSERPWSPPLVPSRSVATREGPSLKHERAARLLRPSPACSPAAGLDGFDPSSLDFRGRRSVHVVVPNGSSLRFRAFTARSKRTSDVAGAVLHYQRALNIARVLSRPSGGPTMIVRKALLRRSNVVDHDWPAVGLNLCRQFVLMNGLLTRNFPFSRSRV